MTEQQYTCPKCFKNYTRFTIQEHYACGVEPLDNEARPTINVDAVVSNVKNMLQSGLEADLVSEIPVEPVAYGKPAETAPTVETVQPEEIAPVPIEQAKEAAKPAPKKRGPKPKVKTVA